MARDARDPGVVVDTSAILALLNADDRFHPRAKRGFERLETERPELVTTSYVLVESYSLIGSRIGLEALMEFRSEFASLFAVEWVAAELHEDALDLLDARGKPSLSLTDAASFVLMRRDGIETAFSFDRHFENEGFSLIS